jgi:hypothetical protein
MKELVMGQFRMLELGNLPHDKPSDALGRMLHVRLLKRRRSDRLA